MNGPMNGQAAGTVSCRRDDLLIERIDRIGSTSTALLERPALVDDEAAAALAAAGQPVAGIGAVWLVALHQTGGRGRRGRAWRSDPQASLAASLAIEAALPAEPGALTLVAGAAVARTLVAFGARPVLKWPNDVYLQRADGALSKAGGILCESRIISAFSGNPGPGGGAGTGHRPSSGARPIWRLVVGCGLNLFPASAVASASSPAPTPTPTPTPTPAEALAGPPPGHLFDHFDPALRERLEVALGAALASAIVEALRDGPAAGLADWRRFDLLAGQPIRIHTQVARGGVARAGPAQYEETEAIARGIDASGRLLVSDAGDPARCRALVAEEVSIRRLGG